MWDVVNVMFISSAILFVFGFCVLWKLPKNSNFVYVPAIGMSGMMVSVVLWSILLHWFIFIIIIVAGTVGMWYTFKSYFNFYI